MNEPVRFRRILGIRFFVGNEQEAIDEICRRGGLLVVPAAPALKNMIHEQEYRDALLGADLALADSALMVLIWNLTQQDRIPKLSGLKYLRALVGRAEFRGEGASFWVMPSPGSASRNVSWLKGKGIRLANDDIYLAPIYGHPVEDPELLRRLEQRRPQHVILGVGGGTQERLGLFLKEISATGLPSIASERQSAFSQEIRFEFPSGQTSLALAGSCAVSPIRSVTFHDIGVLAAWYR